MRAAYRNTQTATFALLAAGAVLLGATGTAAAADLGAGPPVAEERPPPSPSAWTFSFTPYSWLSGLDGSTTVRGRTTDIDADAIEVLEHLDGVPWMSYGEARNGPLAFYGDIIYAPLGTDAGRTRSLGRLTLDANLGVDVRETIAEAGVIYEIASWRAGGLMGLGTGPTALDVLAGARYWRQEVEARLALTATLDVAGLTLAGSRAIARSGDVEWVDPLVGLRLRHQMAPGQELVLRGDVGGFDAGSTFSWNVVGAYSFEIAAHAGVTYSGILGYRALGVDFEKGSGLSRFEYDVVQHGPLLGLTVSF
ncbi:MAG TPA: hypothetical protein VFZ16_04575 [Hyphomicrobiaceae bacterium]|nr:hypothetical protein [Hyphomicrobiaceae bacterium]